MNNKGFTLLELVIVIAITAVLSMVVLFSIGQYISKGKDSNISASLAVLIPAAERYYDSNSNSYEYFCDPTQPGGSTFKSIITQMPDQASGAPCFNTSLYTANANPKGVCCFVESANNDKWVACARKFTSINSAFCVDSRGIKRDISNSLCDLTGLTVTNNFVCP